LVRAVRSASDSTGSESLAAPLLLPLPGAPLLVAAARAEDRWRAAAPLQGSRTENRTGAPLPPTRFITVLGRIFPELRRLLVV
jgi:hypothetical protein